MKPTLNDNQLYQVEHNEKGIHYFTSVLKLAAYCKLTYSHAFQLANGICKQAKGWTCSIIEDEGDIPHQWIDEKNK